MEDILWKAAYDILENVQRLPRADRQSFIESETSDPRLIKMVAEMLVEMEREDAPDSAVLQPGDRFGRYEIVARLGQGGSSEVFSARDPQLDRLVALKFLSPELLEQGPKATERLIREAKAASALNHPNIITVHDIARDSETEQTAIAMELVDGVALRRYCTPGSPQPLDRILRWARQIASALAAAHAGKIVHRDIKPENIVVRNADDNIKILDFGLARRTELGQESSLSLQAGGTIDYFTPEQVAGQKPTAASDIFAAGTILYELATGRHPFAGDTPLDKLYAISHHNPEPASAIQPELPKEFDKLLAAMLSKQPADRPNAAAVELALAETQQQRLDAPRPQQPGPRRALAVAASVFVAIALAAAAISYRNTGCKTSIDSIAVLPFRHADASLDYLSEGLTHEIALGLAMAPGLRVTGSTNVANYTTGGIDARKTGAELGAAAVLSGDLRRKGELILLDLELLDTRSGAQLWSGQFEQPASTLATFPRDVSGRIAARVGARVVARGPAPATRNPDAYEEYLRARYHYIRSTKQDMALAAEHCERAVQLDPKFAEAWSLLAASQGFTPGMYNSLSPRELYAKMREAIAKAIAINPDLPEVHVTLGGMKFFQESDWVEAEREFRRAIQLNPSDSQAHLFLAILMRVLGRSAEERQYIRRARELDALSPLVANHVAWTEYFRGDDTSAAVELQKAMKLNTEYSPNYTLTGYIDLRRKQYPEAIAAFRKAAMTASGKASLGDLGYAYAISGDRPSALRVLSELQSPQDGDAPAGPIAWVYMGMGDRDQAFRWFLKASDENFQWLKYVNIWPVFDVLRDDPRMASLIHKLRLDSARPVAPR